MCWALLRKLNLMYMYMFQLILTFVLLLKRDLFVFLKQKTLTDVLFLEYSSALL